MEIFLKVLFTFGFLAYCTNTCNLPLAVGTWYTSTRGTWTIPYANSQIYNFTTTLIPKKVLTLDCVSESSNRYTFKTSLEIFYGVVLDFFTCIEFVKIKKNTYVFYIVTPLNPDGGDVLTLVEESACNNTYYKHIFNRHIAIFALAIDNIGRPCPNVLLGKHYIAYETVDGVRTTGVFMDVCSDNDHSILNFNTSGAAFTAGSSLQCIDYMTFGSRVYLHTFNNDSFIDGQRFYRFTCWVIEKNTYGSLRGTVYPSECVSGQTPTTTPYGGQVFAFTETINRDEVRSCILPLAVGTWFSSKHGTWTIPNNTSQIQSFEAALFRKLTKITLECVEKCSNMYTFKMKYQIFSRFLDFYTCIEFLQIYNNTFVCYFFSPADADIGEVFTLDSSSSCSNAKSRSNGQIDLVRQASVCDEDMNRRISMNRRMRNTPTKHNMKEDKKERQDKNGT